MRPARLSEAGVRPTGYFALAGLALPPYTEVDRGTMMAANIPDFPELYRGFQPRILRYLARIVGEAEAEDLTQEVFAKAARALPGFRGEAQLSTWLYRIATNAALDKLRASSTAPLMTSVDMEDEVAGKSPWSGQGEPAVEAGLYRREMTDCIRDFVARLPENYRTVLVLGEFEGLKNQEIADILNLSLDTVKIRLHRARLRLSQKLSEHCGPEWIEANEFLPELKRPK